MSKDPDKWADQAVYLMARLIKTAPDEGAAMTVVCNAVARFVIDTVSAHPSVTTDEAIDKIVMGVRAVIRLTPISHASRF